jgi:hypothetical protein
MNNKCCICGTVRNCEVYLDSIYGNMMKITQLFEDYVIILYYDESSDNTIQKLNYYSSINNKFTFYVNTDTMDQYRTHRLAKGRNYCIQQIRDHYADYNYFIMIDCDDVCSGFLDMSVLLYYLNDNNEWDGLSFNHPSGYYDLWALSKRPYVYSCHNYEKGQSVKKYIEAIIKNTPDNELIPCLSAFNGFGLYKTNKFINCSYNGVYNTDYIPTYYKKEHEKYAGNPISIISDGINTTKEDCEHRYFHITAVLNNKARLCISPKCLFIT